MHRKLLVLIFIAFIFAVGSLKASTLVIRLDDQSHLQVEFMGETYSSTSQEKFIDLEDLPSADYFIKVYSVVTPESKVRYSLFEGWVTLFANVEQLVEVTDDGKCIMIEKTPFYDNEESCQIDCCDELLQEIGMNSIKFKTLLKDMNNEVFQSEKMETARRSLWNSDITSLQLREMLNLFTFDSDKFEFVQYAYNHIIDAENISFIYDAFIFSSYKDKLDKFIGIEQNSKYELTNIEIGY